MSADSIQVALRVRPLLRHERDAGHKICMSASPSASQVQIKGPISNEAFTFTHVYSESQPDSDLYKTSIKPLISHLFSGYNVTVLAYGQTGSGKTYSMGTSCGTDGGNDQGVIPRSMREIFEKIKKAKDAEYSLSVSFLELYNEQLRDLLQNPDEPPTTVLEVREDPMLGVCIPGLSYVTVNNVEDTIACLTQGSQYRRTGATAMNKVSSRSHAVFTLKLERNPLDGSQATVAKYCLVDLAGSERVKKTQSTGERFKEGVNINMGLLALGNVISALGDDTHKRGHIPYRVSKLTRLLQDSLGGNSYTLMIACVSPSEKNANESLNTLRYADRALKIKNKPIINADIKAAEIGALKSQLEHLRKMLELERSNGYKKCPPGHQRLIDIVMGDLKQESDSIFNERLKATSPRTKNYLRQVGIKIEVDECEEKDGVDTDSSPESRLFPKLTALDSSPLAPQVQHSEEEDALEEQNYEQHQAKLDFELQELDRELKRKEDQMNELNDASFGDLEEKCQLLQQQYQDLLKEKLSLESTLQDLTRQNTKASAQIAEQRRLQIKELERKLIMQSKQLSDLARLKQEKKRDKDKITGLNGEIQNLKEAKVRLAREIKKSADNFRQWKQRQVLEVGRLQAAERKGRNKLDQQAKTFARQQNVMQRKYQEAMAQIKRLQSQRRPVAQNGLHNTEKLETFLDHELEVERSLAMTRGALDHLINERSMLTEKIKELGANKCWEDRFSRNQRLNETTVIQSQIKLQNTQILDLEQKLIGIEIGDSKSPHTRWARVTNLSDARILLNSMFTKFVTSQVELEARNERVVELEEAQMRINQQLKECQNKLRLTEQVPTDILSMPPPAVLCTPKKEIKDTRPPAVSSVLKNKKQSLFHNDETCYFDEEDEEVSDKSTEDDPDWRLTPYLKPQRNEVREKGKKRSQSDDHSGKCPDTSRCSCKGNCSTKRCTCFKSSGLCSENCRCQVDGCMNRTSSQINEMDATFNVLNSTPINSGEISSMKRESSDLSPVLDPRPVCVSIKKKLIMSPDPFYSESISPAHLLRDYGSNNSELEVLESGSPKKKKLFA